MKKYESFNNNYILSAKYQNDKRYIIMNSIEQELWEDYGDIWISNHRYDYPYVLLTPAERIQKIREEKINSIIE